MRTGVKEARQEDPSAAIFDVSEADIDAAIATAHGDPRATIRALLVEHAHLEREISRLTSSGYRRLPLAKLSEVQG